MSIRPFLLSLCAVVPVLTGCSATFDLGPGGLTAVRDLKAEIKAPPAPEIVVDVRQGAIEVEAGEDGVVRVEGEARAGTDDEVARIALLHWVDGNVVRVGWETSDGVYNRRQASLRLKVPKDSSLNLKTGAGTISASGTSRGLDARTNAGPIEVRDVVGKLALETGAGGVEVAGADGEVQARTNAGSVDVAGRFRGASSAESSAGGVSVRLAADAKLKVDASTGAGSVENDFGWTRSKGVGGSVSGTVGDGSEGSLRVRTGAGSVSVLKGR